MTHRNRALVVAALAFAAGPLAAQGTQTAAPAGTPPSAPATTTPAATPVRPATPFGSIVFDRTGVGDTSMFAPLDADRAEHRIARARARRVRSTGRTAPTTTSRRRSTRRRRRSPARCGCATRTTRPTRCASSGCRSSRTRSRTSRSTRSSSRRTPASAREASRAATSIEQFDQILTGNRRVAAQARVRTETVMKVDLAEPLAPGHVATLRRRVALPDPGARRGPHGTRRLAVRARAVVSARQRVRRRARLEHRAVPRPGRVLPGVRRLHTSRSPCRPATSSPSTGTLTNPKAVLTPTQIARLAQAAKSATPVNIVTLDEIKSGAARPKTSGRR